jgi:hypothetical protein
MSATYRRVFIFFKKLKKMKRWAVTTFDFYRSKTDDSALMGYNTLDVPESPYQKLYIPEVYNFKKDSVTRFLTPPPPLPGP